MEGGDTIFCMILSSHDSVCPLLLHQKSARAAHTLRHSSTNYTKTTGQGRDAELTRRSAPRNLPFKASSMLPGAYQIQYCLIIA